MIDVGCRQPFLISPGTRACSERQQQDAQPGGAKDSFPVAHSFRLRLPVLVSEDQFPKRIDSRADASVANTYLSALAAIRLFGHHAKRGFSAAGVPVLRRRQAVLPGHARNYGDSAVRNRFINRRRRRDARLLGVSGNYSLNERRVWVEVHLDEAQIVLVRLGGNPSFERRLRISRHLSANLSATACRTAKDAISERPA